MGYTLWGDKGTVTLTDVNFKTSYKQRRSLKEKEIFFYEIKGFEKSPDIYNPFIRVKFKNRRAYKIKFSRKYVSQRDWFYDKLISTFEAWKTKYADILKDLATRKKLYNFFDLFKAVAVERDVEKMRNLIHPLYLSCVSDKEYQNMINRYFDIFNKNMKIKEVKIEDISKEELPEAIIKKDLEMAAFPDKRISFSYRGEVAGGVYRGGRISILLSLHNGEWKWVPFCSLPSVNK